MAGFLSAVADTRITIPAGFDRPLPSWPFIAPPRF
jgi:hypothetical protein